jgi:DNA-3-methyladenine glycosylase II
MRVGDERIAIAVASQQAVLDLGGRPELADQE